MQWVTLTIMQWNIHFTIPILRYMVYRRTDTQWNGNSTNLKQICILFKRMACLHFTFLIVLSMEYWFPIIFRISTGDVNNTMKWGSLEVHHIHLNLQHPPMLIFQVLHWSCLLQTRSSTWVASLETFLVKTSTLFSFVITGKIIISINPQQNHK